jgi:hypothetical protein
MTPYQEFSARFKLLISKNPNLITTTLSNIFTIRLIGNKTHGNLAEIAIEEFIRPARKTSSFRARMNSAHAGGMQIVL